MAGATVGSMAPDFELPTDGGGRVRLSDFRGRKVVAYFYPTDDTPTCTIEAVDFSKAKAAFAGAGTEVVGISPDPPKAHQRFRARHRLTITLAADPDHNAIDAYGVWREKTLFGRTYMGVQRATFLIGTDGRIAREWRNVRIRGHVDEVLAAARALPDSGQRT
jgi:peroxiredoxin Q/BCP